MQIEQDTFTVKKAFWTSVGLAATVFGLTLLYFLMRAVMAVGGFCASGGPYVIATPCPDNVAMLTPAAIFSMIVGLFVYMANRAKNGPDWTMLWWSGLFLSLGWNFVEFSINPPEGGGIAWGWIICAVLFVVMGLAPLLLIGGGGGFPHPLFGREKEGISAPESGLESRNFLLALHFGSALVGFFLAQFLLQAVS